VANITHPFLLQLGAIALVLFCYYLMTPVRSLPWLDVNNIMAVALAVTLLGMLLLITHRKAIAHVIGFMSMENGIFLLAVVSVHGMPLAIELGIAFDLLVAVILFGVFFFHIRNNIESLDVDRLNLLREEIE
jgi:hydrogenase-4 component E